MKRRVPKASGARDYFLATSEAMVHAARIWFRLNPLRELALRLPEPGVLICGALDEFGVMLIGADEPTRDFLRFVSERAGALGFQPTIHHVCVLADLLPPGWADRSRRLVDELDAIKHRKLLPAPGADA